MRSAAVICRKWQTAETFSIWHALCSQLFIEQPAQSPQPKEPAMNRLFTALPSATASVLSSFTLFFMAVGPA
jgi:hypothetical protein